VVVYHAKAAMTLAPPAASVAVAKQPSPPREQVAPTPHRFSPTEYYFLAEQGFLPDHTELVDGQILEMPAQHSPAAAAIGRFMDVFRNAWHDRDCVVSDMTNAFASGWNPRPDIAIYDTLPPRRPPAHPDGDGSDFPLPRLVIEVADTTLDYDLGEKADRYGVEGVPECWVADAEGRRLWIHRDPTPTPTADGYGTRTKHAADAVVSPLCLPDLQLTVGDLLPAYPEA
jgi:Uma2 family endonuclease